MAHAFKNSADVTALRSLLLQFAGKFQSAEVRISILKNAQVGCDHLNCAANPVDFTETLLTHLLSEPPTSDNVDRHAVVLLLGYIQVNNPLTFGFHDDTELKRLLVVMRTEAKQRSQAARLNTTRAQRFGGFAPSRRYQIDRDEVLLKWDLEKQIAAFELRLPTPPSGLCTYTLGGPYNFLKSYIVERLLRHLQDSGFAVELTELWIREDNLASMWERAKLSDRVSKEEVEAFLFITHTGIPSDQMRQHARAFLDMAEQQVVPALRQHKRLLTIVWGHDCGEPLDLEVQLPPLQSFAVNNVVRFFRKQLEQAGVHAADLAEGIAYLELKLAENGGHPRGTYQVMTEILDCLQGGR